LNLGANRKLFVGNDLRTIPDLRAIRGEALRPLKSTCIVFHAADT